MAPDGPDNIVLFDVTCGEMDEPGLCRFHLKGVDYGQCQKVAQEEDRETQTSKETKA